MDRSPAYYRARASAIQAMMRLLPDDDKKNNHRVLLRNGFIHADISEAMDKSIADYVDTESDAPLSFTELTSYSTWFAMHPDKVAGKEEATSSLHFPITIKATKEQVIDTVKKGMEGKSTRKFKPGDFVELIDPKDEPVMRRFNKAIVLKYLEKYPGMLDIRILQDNSSRFVYEHELQAYQSPTSDADAFQFEMEMLEIELNISGIDGFEIDGHNYPFIPKANKYITGNSKKMDFLMPVIKEYLIKNFKNQSYRNADTGYNILINDNAIGKAFSKKIGFKKIKALTALPEIIQIAKKIKEEPGKKNNIRTIHYFASVVSVEKNIYPFLFTVNELEEKRERRFIYNTIFINTKKRPLVVTNGL